MAKLVNAGDLKSLIREDLSVRFRLRAPPPLKPPRVPVGAASAASFSSRLAAHPEHRRMGRAAGEPHRPPGVDRAMMGFASLSPSYAAPAQATGIASPQGGPVGNTACDRQPGARHLSSGRTPV